MKKNFKIEGMSCNHCVERVRKTLNDLEGVKAIDVSVGMATVQYDDVFVSETIIVDALQKAGYKVSDTFG